MLLEVNLVYRASAGGAFGRQEMRKVGTAAVFICTLGREAGTYMAYKEIVWWG